MSMLQRFSRLLLAPVRHRASISLSTSSQVDSNADRQQDSEDRVSATDDPFKGIAASPFPEETRKVLLAPINDKDVEIKPDGLIYLPEIKYRRILNAAFGPGGWALMPRGEVLQFQVDGEAGQLVTREYALFCLGRFVSQATGEHLFYTRGNSSFGKASESAKSNALMRCCKDLGIASELWDPQFVLEWKAKNSEEVWCENQRSKERRKLWRRKGSNHMFPYPWKAT
ncbi:mitochondrial genome maintenance protein mgm101 homolog isoform X2 [Oscarella lobularis]|uniref:mitochondrial genome maintenance protein mgm101 homolog isoform X2 n=1 Tax=Oscarella lobularis TaxID=121494 RepID=UPI0033135E7F